MFKRLAPEAEGSSRSSLFVVFGTTRTTKLFLPFYVQGRWFEGFSGHTGSRIDGVEFRIDGRTKPGELNVLYSALIAEFGSDGPAMVFRGLVHVGGIFSRGPFLRVGQKDSRGVPDSDSHTFQTSLAGDAVPNKLLYDAGARDFDVAHGKAAHAHGV